MKRDVLLREIGEIIVRTEKHGALYHPASIEVAIRNSRVKFGLNVAVTEIGRNALKKEFNVLRILHEQYKLSYIPKPFLLDETHAMVFLLEEWFEDYHEFHIAKSEHGEERVKLWEYGRGDRFLSHEQSFKIYRQIAMILTLYYDIENYRMIFPWHHAAGDFVARIRSYSNPPTPPFSKGGNIFNAFDTGNNQKNPPLEKGDIGGFSEEKIDVKLTTVRGYEPFMAFDEDEMPHPALALFYFLLHLSVQMRLDRLDGVGDIVWADEKCVDATLTGFFQVIEQKNDFKKCCGSATTFLNVLKSFKKNDLRETFKPLLDQYEQTKDFHVIRENLEDHIGRLYLTLRIFPR